MRKAAILFILPIFLIQPVTAQKNYFDKQAQIKSCHIRIDANAFIANTSIELELYNPGDAEIEALEIFNLNPGQVVTGLQLQLDGKYRNGSIEERWKARSAYNTIVGKRVDPALLQMWGSEHRLNVYPIPAKGSRKVIITLCQAMKPQDNELQYQLPLAFNNEIDTVSIEINVKKESGYPVIKNGLLQSLQVDNPQKSNAVLYTFNKVKANKPLAFSIMSNEMAQVFSCVTSNAPAAFECRLTPAVSNYITSRLDSITVYWDVSRIMNGRNIDKETLYLERYINENKCKWINVVLFNERIAGTISVGRKRARSLCNFLRFYNYNSGSFLVNLDFSKVKSGVILLFSDGYNSFGTALPRPASVPVNCIVSGYAYNRATIGKIIGITGGRMIAVGNNFSYDTKLLSQPDEQYVLGYEPGNGKIILDQHFPLLIDGPVTLSGKILASDSLKLIFGNSSGSRGSQSFYFSKKTPCDDETYKKLKLLHEYDSVMKNPDYWSNQVVFGLTNRIVTPYTSFLVLEKVEDYIKYKIAPPEELEEKCREMNYVYQSEYKLQQLKFLQNRMH